MKILWANCWKGHKVTFGAPWKDPKDKLMLIPMFWRFQKSIWEQWKRKFKLTSPCEMGDSTAQIEIVQCWWPVESMLHGSLQFHTLKVRILKVLTLCESKATLP